MLPVSFGDQAREFAKYVGEFRQSSDPLGPRVDFPALNRGLGKVIEDKTLAGEALDELGGDWKMFRVNQDVISQIELFEHGNATPEFRLQQEAIVGFALHNV